jgi:hypothetical protein
MHTLYFYKVDKMVAGQNWLSKWENFLKICRMDPLSIQSMYVINAIKSSVNFWWWK